MPVHLEDTIAAIATAPGSAERGVLRLTGPAVAQVIHRVFRQTAGASPWKDASLPSRFVGQFIVRRLTVPVAGAMCWWPTRRSYTGQPVAEIHVPGAPPVLDAILEELTSSGARLARRGEFTLRAFLAGRIDLVQAEAVLGVIDASDHEELQQALSQLGGSITRRLAIVRADLIALLGDLEAGLDFVEEDIQFIQATETIRRIQESISVINGLLTAADTRLPSEFRRRVVLAGLPNAGKSTLFNTIMRRERALVSPAAGTTRDYLTAVLDLNGIMIELVDTAGWEASLLGIEGHAQRMRDDQIRKADLIVWCRAVDATPSEIAADTRLRESVAETARDLLRVCTCSDRVSRQEPLTDELAVSALLRHNVDALLETICSRLTLNNATRDELLGATAARCRDSLIRSAACLQAAAESVTSGGGDEITAMELRQALQEIATIMGDVYTDDILDHIFSSFCIGK